MKMVMLGGAASIVGGGMYLHGAPIHGEVYPIPVNDAYHALAALSTPEELGRGGARSDVSVEFIPDESVTWRFKRKGKTYGVYRAKLTGLGEGGTHTRVGVTFEKVEDKPANEMDALRDAPMLQKLAHLAMNERIDSTLENRPYDQGAVDQAMAAYLLANPQAVGDFQREAFTAASKTMTEMSKSERMGRETAPGRPTASTKPMTDLSGYR